MFNAPMKCLTLNKLQIVVMVGRETSIQTNNFLQNDVSVARQCPYYVAKFEAHFDAHFDVIGISVTGATRAFVADGMTVQIEVVAFIECCPRRS